MTTPDPSTRSVRRAPFLLRAWFSMAGRVTPAIAERRAARLFLTPRPRRGPTPTELHPLLLPGRPASEATPSLLALPTGSIPLWAWGAGPTVLLLHGWSGGAADMAPIGAALAQGGFKAILFDMPGHGSAEPRPTNLLVYLRTVAALGERLGHLHAIVGHSLGGTTTALAVGQGLVHPDRVVLLAPGLSPWEFASIFAGAIGLPRARIPGMVARTEEIVGASAGSLNAAEAVAATDVPGLLLHDPGDADVPLAHSEAIAAAWKGARLVQRPGLGHRRILKDPETIAEVVRFVRG